METGTLLKTFMQYHKSYFCYLGLPIVLIGILPIYQQIQIGKRVLTCKPREVIMHVGLSSLMENALWLRQEAQLPMREKSSF